MSNIDQQIEQAKEEARAACERDGETSDACATGWDVVEELQAEASHKRQLKPKNSLEQYCDDNPDAAECRVYDD